MKCHNYDKDNDILFVHFGNGVEESIELFDGNLILDFDKKGKVAGFEIYNFMEEMKKSSDKLKTIIEKSLIINSKGDRK